MENESGEASEKPISRLETKLETTSRPYVESRATTVTPSSAKHKPTGFTNQIYPANSQYPINYLPSPVYPMYPYNIDQSMQEMRMMPGSSLMNKGQMQAAHPISSTSTLTSPNLGASSMSNMMIANQNLGRPKSGFGMNQPIAASYVRSAPSSSQAVKQRAPVSQPQFKPKRADMYIATRQNKDELNFDILPPAPPPPKSSRIGYRQQ